MSLGTMLCDGHQPEDIAFTFVDAELGATNLSYGELRDRSERFAAALVELGVDPGNRVATLMGKSAALVAAIVGTLRCGAAYVPLFTAFGPGAAATRLLGGEVKVVVVDVDQRAKLLPSADIPADPPWTVIVRGGSDVPGDLDLDDLLGRTAPRLSTRAVGGDEALLLLFTSGTTGPPKGVELPVRALAGFVAYLDFGLDLRDDDVYWNAVGPGWAYGLYYAIIAPLAAGQALRTPQTPSCRRRSDVIRAPSAQLVEADLTGADLSDTRGRPRRRTGQSGRGHLGSDDPRGDPCTPVGRIANQSR
ncbi:MAG: AMP-binding protein [Acidimicrobiales bacterium]